MFLAIRTLPKCLSLPVLLLLAVSTPLGFSQTSGSEPSGRADRAIGGGLEGLFALDGPALTDNNGDGWVDRVSGRFWLGEAPSAALVAAASELSLRLGFETMAMDLPLSSREPSEADAKLHWVLGNSGLAAHPELSPDSLPERNFDTGESSVEWIELDDSIAIVLRGFDDPSVHHAARILAGRWPKLWTPDGLSITDTLTGLDAFFSSEPEELVGQTVELDVLGLTSDLQEAGLNTLEIRVRLDEGVPLNRLARRVRQAAAAAVGFEGARQLSLVLQAGESDDSPIREVQLTGDQVPIQAGGLPLRAGTGAKRNLDLSTLYTPSGLLGDADSNLIPDRIDAVLSLGENVPETVLDLSARMGLESSGIQIPAVKQASSIDSASDEPTLVLIGDQPLSADLIEEGRAQGASLTPGEGMIQVIPKAFGEKSTVMVGGSDEAGLRRALGQISERFPHLWERGKDRTNIDDVERAVWQFFSGRSPAGQAAIAMYKLDQLMERVSSENSEPLSILVSLEKPDPRLNEFLVERVRERLGTTAVFELDIDDRDVEQANVLFEEEVQIGSETADFLRVFQTRVIPKVKKRRDLHIHARLSEPFEVRQALTDRIKDALREKGVREERMRVEILSAYKQGYSWMEEVVRPALAGKGVETIVIRFAKNIPPEEWPQQAMQTPLRWLHEIFPIDEILARELDIAPEDIRLEMAEPGAKTYSLEAFGADGAAIFEGTFEPKQVLQPYLERFRDYEMVRVTTGWIEAWVGDEAIVNQRIVTDPERFWRHFQNDTLSRVYDYVMERHEGNPRGASRDAPLFGELSVDMELSEPHRLLGLDKELISSIDALHEDIYLTPLMFFRVFGRMARGDELTYPGRVIPRIRPLAEKTIEAASRSAVAKIRFTGFATSRPAVVIHRGENDSDPLRLDIPKVEMSRPQTLAALVVAGKTGVARLDLRVKVDTENDEREALIGRTTPLRADETILSAEQVIAQIEHLNAMRQSGLYRASLAFEGLDALRVFAGWEHEVNLTKEPNAMLDAPGTPSPAPDIAAFRQHYKRSTDGSLVQWDEPIPPPEAYAILGRFAEREEATVYKLGESYLGNDVWAMDLQAPIDASHWSQYKATTLKPTVIYSARQHANEVSSTSHVLKMVEQLFEARDSEDDSALARALERVNVVIHPITNPDGAQLAYDLYRDTPELILHAGYWGSLGMDATSDARKPMPLYPEARLRPKIWEMWLPDIFLNPHGYPSHQLVQLFSEFTGLVRRGRQTERNWSMNKGWFIPGFNYLDDPRYPRHKDAAFQIRDYITKAINAEQIVYDMNQRNYGRYDRYGAQFDKEVFRLEMTDDVLIHTAIKGDKAPGPGATRGYNPKVTIWSGGTEAPDETAHGDWLKLVSTAGLAWDKAILQYLLDGDHKVERKHKAFWGGTSFSLDRPRPPKVESDEESPVDGIQR